MRCAISLGSYLVCGLLLSTTGLSDASDQPLSYVVSYQGVFSAGMPIEIAGAQLEIWPEVVPAAGSSRQVLLQVSTEGYGASELIYPVRFCYRSHLDSPEGATRRSEWWSRTGSKSSRGRLNFDRERRRVLRLEAKRPLEREPGTESDPEGLAKTAASTVPLPKLDRDEALFPPGAVPMDRLAMFWWLRQQPLESGAVLRPAVSNGSGLVGYHIEVEAVEEIPWAGGTRSCFRLRLDPQVADGSEVHSSWLWLSRDGERLPLLLRSSREFGSFEARLLPNGQPVLRGCEALESEEPALPVL